MATNERPRSASDALINVLLIGVLAVVGWLAWPSLVTQFQARTGIAPLAAPAALPTAIVRPAAPASQPRLEQPAIAPQDAIADYNATAEAQYRDAVQAQQQPNVNTTGDAAPLQRISKPADRQPAGDIVPTAAPIPDAQSTDQFGSKPAAPINIQETHTCLHGQIWTERGCKNPTPTQ